MKRKFIHSQLFGLLLAALTLSHSVVSAQMVPVYTDNQPTKLNRTIDTAKAGAELIAPYESTAALKIYPNPATTNLYLQMPPQLTYNSQIDVYNILGQNILEVLQGSNALVTIDVSRWAEGKYIARATNGIAIYTGSFIVVRH